MYGSLSWLKTCSIESRCRKHWVHPWPDAWHCQNRTAWGFQTQDQAEDSGGKKVMNFCLQCHDQATWGLMSLWQMPFEWMYARDLEVNRVHTLAQASLSNVKILKKWTSQSTWRAGTCRAWWRWPEWFASACYTVLPPKGRHWRESSQVDTPEINCMIVILVPAVDIERIFLI